MSQDDSTYRIVYETNTESKENVKISTRRQRENSLIMHIKIPC